MDRLTSMAVFARVAASRSFSAAARQLDISQATASKHVQTLETWLGTRLLHRTTRRVDLTEAGERFYVQCTRILEDMEAARTVTQPQVHLSGTLRLAAPVAFGSICLGPALVEFMELHPAVSFSVNLSDRQVDVLEEGFDLAVRTGKGSQPGLAYVPLISVRHVLCAAPSYLARHGAPRAPADLARHHCIGDDDEAGGVWRLVNMTGEADIAVSTRIRCNNGLLGLAAARAGAGVLRGPEFLVQDDLAAGRLVRLLPGFTPLETIMHAVCPANRARMPKTRSLITHLSERLAGASSA